MDAIYARRAVPQTREALYHIVENLCRHGQGPALFTKVRAKFEDHVTGVVRDIAQRTSRIDSYDAWHTTRSAAALHHKLTSCCFCCVLSCTRFLEFVDGCWRSYCESLGYIQSVFSFLETSGSASTTSSATQSPSKNPHLGTSQKNTSPLWTLSAQIFREKVSLSKCIGWFSLLPAYISVHVVTCM